MSSNNTSYPLITILLPVYNSEKTILRCINSIKLQIEKKFKVVISDNCSNDNTLNIINNIIRDDIRFTLITQKTNIGAHNNFRFLINYVNTKYAMFIGSDDHININYLSESIKILENDSSISIVFPNVIYHHNGINFSGISEKILNTKNSNRLFKYFYYVSDNGNFYSLVRSAALRNSINNLIPVLNSNGLDHFIIADILLYGRAEKSDSLFIFREIGNESMKYKNLNFINLIKQIFIDSIYYVINFNKLITINKLKFINYLNTFFIIFCRNFIKRPLGISGSILIKNPIKRYLYNEKN